MANSKLICKQCRIYHPAESIIRHPIGKFCSDDCVMLFVKVKQESDRAKKLAKVKADIKIKEKADRAQHKADKERVKTRTEWFDQLQTLVNQYVLHVIGENKACCTCEKSKPDVKYDAGHYRSRGASKELRFELTNIHKQCSVNCNQHGSGMRAEYREFIVKEYGQDHLDWLDGPHPTLKEQFPHWENIKAEIVRYRKLLRDNGLKPYV